MEIIALFSKGTKNRLKRPTFKICIICLKMVKREGGKKPGEGEGVGRAQGTRDFRVRFSLCNLELSNEILMENCPQLKGEEGVGESQGRSPRVLSLTPSGLSLRPRELNSRPAAALTLESCKLGLHVLQPYSSAQHAASG